MSTPAQMKHTPEPWVFVEHLTWPGFGHIAPIMTDEMGLISKEIGARVCQCVNALAGVADPEAAIRAAREALQHLLEWEPRIKDEDEATAWNEARKALTLLTPKP